MLDEGTANLDPDTESRIADLLMSIPITKVLVAHRPALIQRADSVFYVANGSVRQIGKA